MAASKKRERGSEPPRRDPAAGPPRTREATVHEAKTRLSRLLVKVEAGETVVITRRGKPVAKLEAIVQRPNRVFGSMKGLIAFDDAFFDPLPDDELEAWGQA